MELIPLIQNVLIGALIVFAIVLIVSYVFSKLKKEKQEESPTPQKNVNTVKSINNNTSHSYTASSSKPKLNVDSPQQQKYIKQNKKLKENPRFKIINTKDEE